MLSIRRCLVSILAALASVAGVASGCDARDDRGDGAGAAIALTDALGREVRLPAPARRLVSLAPSCTEIVFAIGCGDRLVARDGRSDYPPEAARVPSLGEIYPRVNLELVLAADPDLVLAGGVTHPEDVRALARLGLVVYATTISETLADVERDILAIGRLAGAAGAAEALAADMARRIEAVRAGAAQATRRPLVLYEIDATDPAKPWTAGPDSFISELIEIAGGRNLGDAGRGKYFQMSLEAIVQGGPEIIILGSARHGGQTPETVRRRAGWQDLPALRDDRVHAFDDDLVSRPGPRIAHGLDALARIIQPDRFP